MKIIIDNTSNYPHVEGAGLLGEIVNKRWSDMFVEQNYPDYLSFNDMAINVLIEDYNERKTAQSKIEEKQ